MIQRTYTGSTSIRSRLVSALLRLRLKPKLTAADLDPVRLRAWIERNARPEKIGNDVALSTVEHGTLKGEWLTPASAKPQRCMLYLHGGGYVFGSPRVSRRFVARLAQLCEMAIFSLDYRLAPEHAYPAPVDDAVQAYEWLLRQGFEATEIIIAGDSAGGGLALALLHAIKLLGYECPAGAMLLSPYTDLLATGHSLATNANSCAMFDSTSIRRAASLYLQGQDARSPMASPLYGDFTDFPPVAIYVSDSELLRDDAFRVAEKIDSCGSPVQLNVWRGQPHVWPTFYPYLPEAQRCMVQMATFADDCLRSSRPSNSRFASDTMNTTTR